MMTGVHCYYENRLQHEGLTFISASDLEKMAQSQPTANQSVDQIFSWRSQGQSFDSQCRLRIYYLAFNQAVVIITELEDNPGKSITDTAQQLIHLVCYRFGLAPYKVMWIEHYPAGDLKKSETYDLITLTLGRVTSQRISLHYLENLLGCSLKIAN